MLHYRRNRKLEIFNAGDCFVDEQKKQVPVPVVIVACVLAVAFLGWWGYRNFGPQDPPKTAENLKVDAMIDEMVKKSGGDFSKLSPEEQAKLNGMSGGRGAMIIAGKAGKLGKR